MSLWNLAEGIEKLLPQDERQEQEISDLGIATRQLTLEVSFAPGSEDGREGISVILSLPNHIPSEDEGEDHWFFSHLIYPHEGESMQALAARIAKELGISPDERVWQDGETI